MLFKYKAKTSAGAIIDGEAEAINKFSLAAQLKKKNFTVILAKEIQERRSYLRAYLEEVLGVVHLSEKIVFIRSLGAMMEAGLSLSRALSVLGKQTKNRAFQKIINEIERDITKGSSLNETIERFPGVFSDLSVAMIKAGEESGKLSESLKVVAEQLDKNYQLKKKIRGALFYPAVIIVAMAVIGVIMLTYVVPILTSTFKELGVELPFATKVVIGVSSFLVNYTILVLSLVVAFIVAIIFSVRTSRGKRILDFLFLKIPLIGGLTKEINSARTARTLSSLLTAGVTILDALNTTKDVVQNSYYKKVLEDAHAAVQRGTPLSFVFNHNQDLYPVLVGEMTAVGEETGKLSQMLLNLASFYEEQVAQKTKDLSTIIEPILMIVIGLAVGLFAVSLITPLYSVLGEV
ncbi:hypothetical protein CL630_01850 [bacterium]|nr:hypothetical protein [bacterium]|tara:strand:+ start:13050 stop:14264 length:1215 start_codon:yes stop_codon:yes gene_type:complete